MEEVKRHIMKPAAFVSSIAFSGGQKVGLGRSEKVVLVGPNNSGKSLSLRELQAIAAQEEEARTMAITSIELEKTGSAEDMRGFLEKEAEWSGQVYRYPDWQLQERAVAWWDIPFLTRNLAAGLVKTIVEGDRLAICEVQDGVARGDQKSRFQHVMYDDSRLMSRISRLF